MRFERANKTVWYLFTEKGLYRFSLRYPFVIYSRLRS